MGSKNMFLTPPHPNLFPQGRGCLLLNLMAVTPIYGNDKLHAYVRYRTEIDKFEGYVSDGDIQIPMPHEGKL
jgi:hypothetical protein